MVRLNKAAQDILSIKAELEKDYSDIVKQSLFEHAKTMLTNLGASTNVFELLKNGKISELKAKMEKEDVFLLTELELEDEMRKELKQIEKLNKTDFEVTIDVKNAVFVFKKQIKITKDDFLAFFDIGKSDIESFMKPKGRGSVFADLRLKKIIKDSAKEIEEKTRLIQIGYATSTFTPGEYGMDIVVSLSDEDVINDKLSLFLKELKLFEDTLNSKRVLTC